MQVHLRRRKLKNKSESLYLDYYHQGERQREYLNLWIVPGKAADNKLNLELAEAIRSKRDHEIKAGMFGFIAAHKKKANFFTWMQVFVDSYDKKDYRMYKALLPCFKTFLGDIKFIPCSAVGNPLILAFNKYLHKRYHGETPFNYFAAMKRILKAAVADGMFQVNPADGIRNVNSRRNELTKQVLMDDEIQLLAATPCGNEEVKRAFLFSTQTGLRKVDIKLLKWNQVFIEAGYIDFSQSKTGRRNTVPLNGNAMALLGKPGNPDAFVFELGISDTAVNKVLKYWVKRAGIDKRITYHCARHSCGTNLLIHGADLKTTSSTLGHSSTRQTEKYTRISDAMKQRAVSKLPKIMF